MATQKLSRNFIVGKKELYLYAYPIPRLHIRSILTVHLADPIPV